jgi:hypothetical protein
LNAFSLYSFDSQSLVWRECKIVGYQDPLFQIIWPGTDHVKELYRISVRFEFDDEFRFDERRARAIQWRYEEERLIRLYAYLASELERAPHVPNFDSLQRAVSLLPEELRKSFALNDVIGDLIQVAGLGDRIAIYIADYEIEEKANAFREKDLPEITLYKPDVRVSGALDPSRFNLMWLPPRPAADYHGVLCDLRQTPTYRRPFNEFGSLVSVDEFFAAHEAVHNEFVENLTLRVNYALSAKARELLPEDRVPEIVEKVLQMADMRLIVTL